MTERNEWLQWRLKGIGSSDAACIHGESPYMTALDLYNVKIKDTYEETEQNWVQRIGNDFEAIARVRFAALYNMENGTNETFEPKRVEMADLPFMKASLDGASKCGKIIVEFKFMSKPVVAGKALSEGQKKHLAVLEGKVQENYRIQVQHQLLVTGADVCYFVSFDGETLNSCSVLPDIEFLKLHLKKCCEFWDRVEARKPPEPSSDDYKELRVKGAKGKVQRWKRIKMAIDQYSAEMDTLKEEIISMCDHERMTCDGVRIVKYPGNQGSVDWAKAYAATGVTLDTEKFRKAAGKPYVKMEIQK